MMDKNGGSLESLGDAPQASVRAPESAKPLGSPVGAESGRVQDTGRSILEGILTEHASDTGPEPAARIEGGLIYMGPQAEMSDLVRRQDYDDARLIGRTILGIAKDRQDRNLGSVRLDLGKAVDIGNIAKTVSDKKEGQEEVTKAEIYTAASASIKLTAEAADLLSENFRVAAGSDRVNEDPQSLLDLGTTISAGGSLYQTLKEQNPEMARNILREVLSKKLNIPPEKIGDQQVDEYADNMQKVSGVLRRKIDPLVAYNPRSAPQQRLNFVIPQVFSHESTQGQKAVESQLPENTVIAQPSAAEGARVSLVENVVAEAGSGATGKGQESRREPVQEDAGQTSESSAGRPVIPQAGGAGEGGGDGGKTATGGSQEPEGERNNLTSEAQELLSKLETGGAIPAFVSRNLERILRENGVSEADIQSKTPDDLINILRQKTKAAGEAESASATVESRPSSETVQAEPAGGSLGIGRSQSESAQPDRIVGQVTGQQEPTAGGQPVVPQAGGSGTDKGGGDGEKTAAAAPGESGDGNGGEKSGGNTPQEEDVVHKDSEGKADPAHDPIIQYIDNRLKDIYVVPGEEIDIQEKMWDAFVQKYPNKAEGYQNHPQYSENINAALARKAAEAAAAPSAPEPTAPVPEPAPVAPSAEPQPSAAEPTAEPTAGESKPPESAKEPTPEEKAAEELKKLQDTAKPVIDELDNLNTKQRALSLNAMKRFFAIRAEEVSKGAQAMNDAQIEQAVLDDLKDSGLTADTVKAFKDYYGILLQAEQSNHSQEITKFISHTLNVKEFAQMEAKATSRIPDKFKTDPLKVESYKQTWLNRYRSNETTVRKLVRDATDEELSKIDEEALNTYNKNIYWARGQVEEIDLRDGKLKPKDIPPEIAEDKVYQEILKKVTEEELINVKDKNKLDIQKIRKEALARFKLEPSEWSDAKVERIAKDVGEAEKAFAKLGFNGAKSVREAAQKFVQERGEEELKGEQGKREELIAAEVANNVLENSSLNDADKKEALEVFRKYKDVLAEAAAGGSDEQKTQIVDKIMQGAAKIEDLKKKKEYIFLAFFIALGIYALAVKTVSQTNIQGGQQ